MMEIRNKNIWNLSSSISRQWNMVNVSGLTPFIKIGNESLSSDDGVFGLKRLLCSFLHSFCLTCCFQHFLSLHFFPANLIIWFELNTGIAEVSGQRNSTLLWYKRDQAKICHSQIDFYIKCGTMPVWSLSLPRESQFVHVLILPNLSSLSRNWTGPHIVCGERGWGVVLWGCDWKKQTRGIQCWWYLLIFIRPLRRSLKEVHWQDYAPKIGGNTLPWIETALLISKIHFSGWYAVTNWLLDAWTQLFKIYIDDLAERSKCVDDTKLDGVVGMRCQEASSNVDNMSD